MHVLYMQTCMHGPSARLSKDQACLQVVYAYTTNATRGHGIINVGGHALYLLFPTTSSGTKAVTGTSAFSFSCPAFLAEFVGFWSLQEVVSCSAAPAITCNAECKLFCTTVLCIAASCGASEYGLVRGICEDKSPSCDTEMPAIILQ